jgi:POT family proton-dependent oligopeptide transporter
LILRFVHGRYALIAFSEILASITGFEYAFTKAPANMRSLVMALFMGTGAVSAVLSEGFLCKFSCVHSSLVHMY